MDERFQSRPASRRAPSAHSLADRSDRRSRHHSPTPPPPLQRPHKPTTNIVRPRPANHAISHILQSLDASPDETEDSRSLTDSTAYTTFPSGSPGSGSAHASHSTQSEQVAAFPQLGAAFAPTIRSSRSPSGTSIYAPNVGSSNAHGYSRHNRSQSSKSSLRSKASTSTAKNKLSAESWVTQALNSASQPDTMDAPASPDTTRTQRSLRRKISRESLRPSTADPKPVPHAPIPELRALSRAEEIIARSTPVKPASRGRLYLNEDTGVFEERAPRFVVPRDTPAPSLEPLAGSGSARDSIEATSASNTTTPARSSPNQSAIVDSIPTRTSSLRGTSRSPHPSRRKEKKQKRPALSVRTEAAADKNGMLASRSNSIPEAGWADKNGMLASRSNSIPEASWADLDVNDETVRRIRELRELRKSRMEGSSPVQNSIPAHDSGLDPAQVTVLSAIRKPAADARSGSHRTMTEPAKYTDIGLRVNGHGAPMPTPRGPYESQMGLASITSDQWRHIPIPTIPHGAPSPLSASFRPNTAKTTLISAHSLDYSYADAVDALQKAEREPYSPSTQLRSPLSDTSEFYPNGAEDATPGASPTPGGGPGSKRTRKMSNRWVAQTDASLDLQRRKSRRASSSEVRHVGAAAAGRPDMPSRDSVDDMVVEYLRDPRLSREVKHPMTGRLITFSEVGDPNGSVVFVCIGMGLTRYVTAFYDELATTLRLRLITPDRPGVGGSEPYPSTNRIGPLSWPEDVLAICEELNIPRFSLLAHSAGAIYALATALILPHLVKGKVHLLAPWIPPSQLEATSHPTVSAPPLGALPRSQRFLRVLPTSFLKAANSSFMTATSTSIKPASKKQMEAAREQRRVQRDLHAGVPSQPVVNHHRRESMMVMDQFMPMGSATMEDFPRPMSEQDMMGHPQRDTIMMSATALPTDPEFSFASAALNAAEHAERERQIEYSSRLTQLTWELATRDSNPATDLLVCLERNRDVGFRYTDVTRDVVITHGSEDKRVPVGNVRWLAEQMNARALAAAASRGLRSSGEDDGSVSPTREGWADPLYTRGGCEVRVLEGEGHGLMASAPIMSGVLTEIAEYWTGHKIRVPHTGGPVGGGYGEAMTM